MLLQPRIITACLVLATGFTASCAPAPKWNPEAEAKPFLREMTFADQKSIKVHRFEAWDQRFSTLIFATDKVDFDDPFITQLGFERLPSKDQVEVIELLSEYRFSKPAAKRSWVVGNFWGNKHANIDIVQDGDHYVCYVVVLKPKPEDLPAAPSKK